MDLENYCVCKQRPMEADCDQLLRAIKAYRNDMVARNYPFQQLYNLIVKYENLLDEQKTPSEKLQDDLEPIE